MIVNPRCDRLSRRARTVDILRQRIRVMSVRPPRWSSQQQAPPQGGSSHNLGLSRSTSGLIELPLLECITCHLWIHNFITKNSGARTDLQGFVLEADGIRMHCMQFYPLDTSRACRRQTHRSGSTTTIYDPSAGTTTHAAAHVPRRRPLQPPTDFVMTLPTARRTCILTKCNAESYMTLACCPRCLSFIEWLFVASFSSLRSLT